MNNGVFGFPRRSSRVAGGSVGPVDLADPGDVTGVLPVANIALSVRDFCVKAEWTNGNTALVAGSCDVVQVRIPWGCTIIKSTIFGDVSGSAVVDIWKDSYANHPPTVADTITASAKPTLSSASRAEDSTLTGWTTSITAGQFLAFKVDSVSTLKYLAVELEIRRTA